MQALGLIEVTGYLAAIAAADAALKAANVELLRSEKIRGGLTTIELVGDVAAVTASVDAGKRVAEDLGRLRSSHVIARLDRETEKMLTRQPKTAQAAVTKEQAEQDVRQEEPTPMAPAPVQPPDKDATIKAGPVVGDTPEDGTEATTPSAQTLGKVRAVEKDQPDPGEAVKPQGGKLTEEKEQAVPSTEKVKKKEPKKSTKKEKGNKKNKE